MYAILCPCCGRLVEAIASGKQSKAIVGAIEAKEAEAEALKVKAPEFNPDRAALRRAGLAYVRWSAGER